MGMLGNFVFLKGFLSVLVNNFRFLVQSPPTSVDFGGFSLSTDITNGDFAGQVLSIGAYLGSFIALIMIVSGGYKMLMSGGDPQKIKDGRDQITNAGMGLALIILASSVIRMVFGAIGLS